MLEDNLREVQRKIEEACSRSGRSAEDVTLCAVSKTKPNEDILTLYNAGQRDFGENYIQELRKKHEELPKDIRWHMIGHLQRNKVKYIVDKVRMIHSVDTIELAQQIEKEAAKRNVDIDVLMEVNIAQEESKWGFTAEEAPEAAKQIGTLPHVHLHGLMTSAPITDNAETNRVYFRGLRQLAEKIGAENYPNVVMDTLSMGMTADYEVAIEEGATIVRVGTAIFGARNYSK